MNYPYFADNTGAMKRLFGLLLLFFACSAGLAQTAGGMRVAVQARQVPELVKTNFNEKYSDVLVKGWYTTHHQYWSMDISSGWYNGWYGERTTMVYTFEKQNYFEVEFIDEPGTLSRALYNRLGYWYETRTRQRGLLPVQTEALQNSPFAGWKLSDLVEKIQSADWPDNIYRFQLSKGRKSVILRMNDQGEILQEKHLAGS
jgi:hypothetical protein